LLDRLEYERGSDHEDDEVLLMTPTGRRYEILSLNWDDKHGHWVLIGDRAEA
jgi:hypothetical protein